MESLQAYYDVSRRSDLEVDPSFLLYSRVPIRPVTRRSLRSLTLPTLPHAPLCSPFKRTCSLSSLRVLRAIVGSRRVVTPVFGHYLYFCSFLCCSSSFPIGTTLSSSLCHL